MATNVFNIKYAIMDAVEANIGKGLTLPEYICDKIQDLALDIGEYCENADKQPMDLENADFRRRMDIIRNYTPLKERNNVPRYGAGECVQDLLNEVHLLSPRIKAIIELANACWEHHIEIPDNSDTPYRHPFLSYGNKGDFVALVGKNGPFQNIGISQKLICDGTDIRAIVDSNTYYNGFPKIEYVLPTEQQLKKFLRQFIAFENAFYIWLDSLANDFKE